MAQASQGVGLSARKRTRPTVNLNAASRRRKDNTCGDDRSLENNDPLNSERKEGCSDRESVVRKVNSNRQDERTTDKDPEESILSSKNSQNLEEVIVISQKSTKSVSEELRERTENKSSEQVNECRKSDVKCESDKSGSSVAIDDSTTSEVAVDVLQPPSKKPLPKTIHRFSRRNFTPNVKRERHVNDAHSKTPSLNKSESHSELSTPPISSLNQEKENADCNKISITDVSNGNRSSVNDVNISDKNLEKGGRNSEWKSKDCDVEIIDSGAEIRGKTEKDVIDLDDSGDESRFSVSSSVSTVLRCESFVDSDSCLEDDRSSICEDNIKSDKLMKPPKQKRGVNPTSRRLHEAKREFESKYGNKTPDRKSMRMFDLIYYNPLSNPMKPSDEQPKETVVSSLPAEPESDALAEENVDNPDEVEEDEVQVPAPRVKVGPDGEIILDEQSLVIETTLSKKSRKEMANLTVVVDTGSSTTYNTYSKKKRHRSDWNAKDTIKFYKALQAIGTDFSLMQTLFPTRSRVDLKTKFKKEEKMNGRLVEKALRYPSVFDLSELEKELEDGDSDGESCISSKSGNRRRANGRKKKGLERDLGFDKEDTGHDIKDKSKKPGKRKLTSSSGKEKNKRRKPSRQCTGKEAENKQGDVSTTRQLRERKPRKSYDDDNDNGGGFDLFTRSESEEEQESDEEREQTRRFLAQGSAEPPQSCKNTEAVDTPSDTVSELVPHENGQIVNQEEEIANNIVYEGQLSDVGNVSLDDVPPGSIVLFTTECPDKPGYQICNVFMVQDRSIVNNVNLSQTIGIPVSSGQEEIFQARMEETEPS